MHLLPNTKRAGIRVPQLITCLTFLIPMSRAVLGLRVLWLKGLVWLGQKRNPIDEVINSIQDIISTQLKRTSTPTCCTTKNKEKPLNNSFLDLHGKPAHSTATDLGTVALTRQAAFPLSDILPFVPSECLACLQSHFIDITRLSNRGFTLNKNTFN